MIESKPQAHPDSALVRVAVARYADWAGVPTPGNWDISAPREYRHSTIYFIELPGSDPPSRLVYKLRRSPDPAWFERNLPLVAEAVQRLESEGMHAAPIIAADAERGVVVTPFLPGDELRPVQWWERRLTKETDRIYREVGRACRILETVAAPFADEKMTYQTWSEFSGRLSEARFAPELARDVERYAKVQFDSATGGVAPFVMAHRDMSYSNIIIEGHFTGFIDLGFAPALSGFPLAKILHRIDYASRLPSAARKEAAIAVMDGYGMPVAVESMSFLRIDMLLRSLPAATARSWVAPGRRRALNELTNLIYDPRRESR
jgi:Phosphotransferase enzyme family